jgi:prepilin-type N-terminal cleavage/methylation domain-containing protein
MLQKLNTKHTGFTLVEIMIVVAIIALLAAIAVPNFLRSRKRSQATQILQDLRILDAAIDQYCIEYNKGSGGAFGWGDLQKYVKQGTRLYSAFGTIFAPPTDILGNEFQSSGVVDDPTLKLYMPAATWNALSDVAPADFWSPYGLP